jgi:hypothetical protein
MQHSEFKIQNGRRLATARLALFAFCILHLAFAAACAKAKAADLVPDGPPLAMTSPPPRVITPAEEVAVATPPPSAPEPATAVPTGTPASPRTRAPQRNSEAPPPAAAQQPPPPPVPVTTPPPLEVRSVPSTAAAGEEKKVREVMQRASNDLNRVNYQRLSAEGKSQYDQSKRFNEQADAALKEKNFPYAMTLAEKAATFAAELAAR